MPIISTGRTPYDAVLNALQRAAMSKAELTKITGIPYGPLGHALEVLILEGKVKKEGMRYKRDVRIIKSYS